MTIPKVAIVILNWNGWKDTIECLESVYQITYENFNVIIVDNGSKDKSIKKINEYSQGQIKIKSNFFEYNLGNKPIQIIEYIMDEADAGGGKEKEIIDLASNKKLIIINNGKNLGFAKGNNIGIKYALNVLFADYVLLLNNDTVVEKDFLDIGINYMQENENVGIVTSKIYYYNYPNKIWAAGGQIKKWIGDGGGIRHNQLDNGQFNTIKSVAYAPGTMALIKKSVFEKVGLLPECYFATGEEMEFAIKTRKIGYDIVCNPDSIIYHKVGMSDNRSLKYRYNSWRTRLLFIERNVSNNLIWKIVSTITIWLYLCIKLIMLDFKEIKCFLLARQDHAHKKIISEDDLNKVDH